MHPLPDALASGLTAHTNKEPMTTFLKTIEETKQTLTTEVARRGLYENFGQSEVRKLNDLFATVCNDGFEDYSAERNALAEFQVWAMNYAG